VVATGDGKEGSTFQVRQRASLCSLLVPARSLEPRAIRQLGRRREKCPRYARVERNAFTLVVRGSFSSCL
jgi:hypothetical protein